MKKSGNNKLNLFAVVLLSIVCVFGGCSYVDTNYEGGSKLDKPSVSARAWPGVNILTWTAVPAAASYNIYRNGDTPVNTTALAYSDINIVNGQEYKYTVEAVFSLKSEANVIGTATTVYLTGIRPPAGTAADDSLNLAAYESGSDGSTRKTADKTAASYLTPARLGGYAGNGVIYAEFPAKPYLKYNVEAEYTADTTYSGSVIMQDLFLTDKNYTIGGTVLPILRGGEWKINVTAEALNPIYRQSQPVTSTESITIDSLNVGGNVVDASSDGNLKAVYTGASKVRLAWLPTSNGSSAFPVSCYKVYRQSVDAATGLQTWNLVSGTVAQATVTKTASSKETIYYIDDSAAAAESTYALVLSKDYAYANAVKQNAPAYAGSATKISLTASTTTSGAVTVKAGAPVAGETITVSYAEYSGLETDDAVLAGIYAVSSWEPVSMKEVDENSGVTGATAKNLVLQGDTGVLSSGLYIFRLDVSNASGSQTTYQFYTAK